MGLPRFGTVASLWTEYNNPGTIGIFLRLVAILNGFQAVSMRTAGFAIDADASQPTLFILSAQMFKNWAFRSHSGVVLKIHDSTIVLCFLLKEILGLPHTNMGRRTLAPRWCRRLLVWLVIFQPFISGSLALGPDR